MKTLHIPEKTHEKLKEHCEENGFKINKLVEKLINEYLSKKMIFKSDNK